MVKNLHEVRARHKGSLADRHARDIMRAKKPGDDRCLARITTPPKETWLYFYNYHRPHSSLVYNTPVESMAQLLGWNSCVKDRILKTPS